MIEIKQLNKSFGDLSVLKGIDLVIEEGCFFGLAGKSGSGKSTLLRCINRLEEFQSGQIIINGVDISSLRKKELLEFRRNIGMIFQQFSLISTLSVYENIELPLKCWKFSQNERKKRIDDLLRIVGLEDKRHIKPNQISGGQKQRVAIARALALHPQILLCDEATSALDPTTAKTIMDLLTRINKETKITIVFVSHQLEIIQRYCDEMAILEDGKVTVKGETRKIFIEKPDAFVRLVGNSNEDYPEIGMNLEIIFESLEQSKLVFHLPNELKNSVKILKVNSNSFKSGEASSMVVNIDESAYDVLQEFLLENSLKYRIL